MAAWRCSPHPADSLNPCFFPSFTLDNPESADTLPPQPFSLRRSKHVALTKEEVEEKVVNIVCGQLGTSREKVKTETSFINDLGADSLDTVELVMEFEDEFDISIPDEDAEKIQSVGNAIDYIFNKQ